MMLKILVLTIASIAFAASITAFEGAATLAKSADLLSLASSQTLPYAQRRALLDEADQLLRSSWAYPQLWSAEADETLSAIAALKGNVAHGERLLYADSARWAAAAVSLNPASARSWARLSEYGAMGVGGDICGPATCLENSWRFAPMIDADTDCARLRLGYALGALRGANDLRILWYVRSGVKPEPAARCLSFLTPEARYQLLLLAHAERAAAAPGLLTTN